MDKAEEIILTSIKKFPNNTRSYIDLAKLYIYKEDYNASFELLDFLQKQNPNEPCVYYVLGLAHYSTNNSELSIENFNKSIQLFENKNNNSGQLTITATQIACPYRGLGNLYYKLNKTNDAVRYYMKLAEVLPHKSDSQFQAAKACYEIDDYDCALKYVNKAIDIDQKEDYLDLKQKIMNLSSASS